VVFHFLLPGCIKAATGEIRSFVVNSTDTHSLPHGRLFSWYRRSLINSPYSHSWLQLVECGFDGLTLVSYFSTADPVAARCEVQALSARTLDRGFESPLRARTCPWSLRVVLCRYRPCDGLIAHPGSPTVCRRTDHKMNEVEENYQYRNTPNKKSLALSCTKWEN
jgi:hypothetical protein